MDHISNFLNFSLAGIEPPHNTGGSVPSFSDLPLEHTSTPAAPLSPTEETDSKTIDAVELKKRLYALKDEVSAIIRLLETNPHTIALPTTPTPIATETKKTAGGEQIIEGVFNGEKMVGPDGHEYAVPPNYASKSKLVEGDHMKLTVTPYGKFIYKQIGPTERKRIIGVLEFDEATQLWSVVHEGKTYKILTASATFYRGKPGDHVVILVPKDVPSSWGAVENIIAS